MPNSNGYTLEEIVDIISKRIGNYSSDFISYLTEQVKLDHNEVNSLFDWRHLHENGQISYSKDTQYAFLPSNCRSIEAIYDNTGGSKLKRIELRDIRRINPTNSKKGTPTHYAQWSDTKIFLYPTPAENGSLSIDYLRVPNALEAGGYPDMPARLQNLLIHKAYVSALQREVDDRYSIELQVFNQMLANAIRSENIDLEDSSRIRWQDEE